MASFDWIFFDCFNTLIDDFDETGDDSGIGSMHHLVVEAGFYPSLDEFRQDYHQWRKAQWVNQWREVSLPDRLIAILEKRSPNAPLPQIQSLVVEMMRCFEAHYPATLRLPQGVAEMLCHWDGKVQMGVVSNFPIAHQPAQLLEGFGLRSHFDFVLDSADYGWKKPGPNIYHAACQLAEIPESALNRILFIGDHLKNDVLMPMQLGMQALYFDRSSDRPSSTKAPEHIPTITHWDQFRAEFQLTKA